jgi:hypothetical protein
MTPYTASIIVTAVKNDGIRWRNQQPLCMIYRRWHSNSTATQSPRKIIPSLRVPSMAITARRILSWYKLSGREAHFPGNNSERQRQAFMAQNYNAKSNISWHKLKKARGKLYGQNLSRPAPSQFLTHNSLTRAAN